MLWDCGYDGIIRDANDGSLGDKIEIDSIVYAPESQECITENDKIQIKGIISLSNNPKTRIHTTKCLPTIRACIVYDENGDPKWCCIQIYHYKCKFTTISYKKNIGIVGRIEKDAVALKEMTKIINDEFDRLKCHDGKYQIT